jgi:hypothetical protein
MRQRTAKLLRRYCARNNSPYRQAKKMVNAMDVKTKSNLLNSLRGAENAEKDTPKSK